MFEVIEIEELGRAGPETSYCNTHCSSTQISVVVMKQPLFNSVCIVVVHVMTTKNNSKQLSQQTLSRDFTRNITVTLSDHGGLP